MMYFVFGLFLGSITALISQKAIHIEIVINKKGEENENRESKDIDKRN